MRSHPHALAGLFVLLGLIPPAAAADPAALEHFEKKVRPVLVKHCYRCHSAKSEKLKGGLRVDGREALLKGGDSGPAVVPGEPDRSRLITALRYADVALQMPPKGKLPAAVIADLTQWVKQGAPWPDDGSQSAEVRKDFDLQQRKKRHWAWRPIGRPEPPAVRDTSWPRSPVDRFLLAKLEAKGLTPAPDAPPHVLVRRLYFDLIGLPPTPEEVESFCQSASRHPQSAITEAVDRLLASPHFGERWGRHWLDLMRYGESRGHEFDYPAPNAWQYRDYVIRALNADVPYNQFVTEHLAGDLLAKPRLHPVEGFNESILGTGFWFLGEEVHSPVDIRQDQADRFDNRIDVFSKAFLGLTVSCARCHDHKFDAISTRDYYALYGLLESCNYRLVRFDSLEQNRRIAGELARLRDEARPALQRALAAALRPLAENAVGYLLGAREVLQGPKEAAKRQGQIDAVAARRKLDAALLVGWGEHLAAAADNPRDPFHIWAKVALDPAAGESAALKRLLQPFADSRQADPPAGVRVVVDYRKPGPGEWLPDDVTFGTAPARAGDVRLGKGGAVRLVERSAAEFDAVWQGYRLAPGSETTPGALAKNTRPGRTIRTPTFTLEDGKVFYLVRGTGQAYFSVGAHVLIAGPLHGALVQQIKAGPDYRWQGHDLSPYKGQRLHVEFAAESPDFAVAAVVQGSQPPPAVERPPVRLEGIDSLELLAAEYQRTLLDLCGRLAADRLRDTPEAGELSRLANLLLGKPRLFAADGKLPASLSEVIAPVLARQEKLTAQARMESRLAMAMQDGTPVEESVFVRGQHRTLGERVPRRFLEALAGPGPLPAAQGSGRLELAAQMTDPAVNPFLTRVLVNRLWHHLFGRGLVASVDNFGVLGEAPTHPELLDWLATELVREGWSIKKMIRALVLTRAYRLSSRADARPDTADPQDLLLHRARVRRLEGEAIRDALLAISGRLDRKMHGPSVPVFLTPFLDGRGRPGSGPLDGAGRRSLYLAVRRNFLSPFLLAFDTPIPFSTVGRRTVSNVPAQALILLNDPFVHQQAQAWAKRVLAAPGTTAERVRGMYLAAFGRPPTETESAACQEFLQQQATLHRSTPDELPAWTDLAHTLINVKEFIYLH
jgi:hypothetical protein